MTAYRCVVIDPPWEEYGGGGRGAQRHYPLMASGKITGLLARELSGKVANSAHLYCWVTDNYLEDGLGVMRGLGFRYVRTFCWVKLAHAEYTGHPPFWTTDIANGHLQIGLGQYARGSHELCLFGVAGDSMVPEPANRPPSVLFAPRREHSRKPDECFSEWFEKVSPGPRLEIFARSERHGWDSLGNETSKFSARTVAGEITPRASPDG